MTKLISLAEAVERFVPDGASVVMGTGLEGLIPFSAGHEIIRQGKRDLTLIGPISDTLFDQLIGAGCASRVIAAWVGNVSAGLGHCYRRAVEQGVPGPLEVHDHSNFTLALALQAGAWGVPYLPTRTALGSDLLKTNPGLMVISSPYDDTPLVAVRAIYPDVAFVAVQRADEEGGAHVWGAMGVTLEACFASRHLVLLADEIVDHSVIASDPNRVVCPSFRVSAVVNDPFGCHPSPMQGRYGRDHAFYQEYHDRTRSLDGFQAWLEEWVLGVKGRAAYLAHLGAARHQALRPGRSQLAAPVDYGY